MRSLCHHVKTNSTLLSVDHAETLGLTSLMLDFGSVWLQQSIARRRIRIEKQAVSTLSTDVGTTMQKMWELCETN